VADRAFMSIGEVLTLLKDEFPDITISKIRFLESQGLLDPERTPSGYRKFYEPDVERLRWILRQQREHFLPLKVIKGRLASPAPSEQESGNGDAAATEETPTRSAQLDLDMPATDPLAQASTGASLTAAELASATGLEVDDIHELERYGLLTGRAVADTVCYDEDALVVAGLAAGFRKFGVEARHLRMYKNAGEREAGFLEQVVMPLLKQRNPEARTQAVDALGELARLGQSLRGAMLRQALQRYLA
jgi:DNA-binding transcriptional MerR regulator